MRPARTAIAVLAVGTALAGSGCEGDGRVEQSAEAPAATATETTPHGDPLLVRERHTRADMARALAVTVRRADVGDGWQMDVGASAGTALRCGRFVVDEHDLVETGEAMTSFSHGSSTKGSSVVVYRTARMTRTAWARAHRPGYPGCVAQLIARDYPDRRFPLLVRSAAPIAVPGLAEGTAAYRLRFSFTPGDVATPVYYDFVDLREGSIWAHVAVISFGRPTPRAELVRLATLTARRMR